MIRRLFAVLIILAMCAAAPANCRRAVVVQHQHYGVRGVYPSYQVLAVDHNVAVVPVAAVYAIPAIAAYPAYSVSYGQPDVAGLVAEIKALRTEVQSLKAPAQAPHPAMPPAKDKDNGQQVSLSMLEVFRTDCARCHESGVAAKKGGSFVLLEGDALAPLTDKQLRNVLFQVVTEKMPPGGNLSQPKLNAIVSGIGSIK